MSKSSNKHIVKAGETLSHIAQEHYGKASLWTGLVHANKWLFDQGRVDAKTGVVIIKPGEEINLLGQESIEVLAKQSLGADSAFDH